MSDGGFTFVGSTQSYDVGQGDMWLLRAYENGTVVWNHSIGTTQGDSGYTFVSEGNDVYTLAGITRSLGTSDPNVWLLKVNVSMIEEGAPSESDDNGEDGGGDISIPFSLDIFLSVLVVSVMVNMRYILRRRRNYTQN